MLNNQKLIKTNQARLLTNLNLKLNTLMEINYKYLALGILAGYLLPYALMMWSKNQESATKTA